MQPCEAVGSRFFQARSERFFDAARRRVDAWAGFLGRIPGLGSMDRTRLVVSLAGECTRLLVDGATHMHSACAARSPRCLRTFATFLTCRSHLHPCRLETQSRRWCGTWPVQPWSLSRFGSRIRYTAHIQFGFDAKFRRGMQDSPSSAHYLLACALLPCLQVCAQACACDL